MAITGGSIIDADGSALTSQLNGTQQALDVGVNVAGIQIDPRQVRPLTSSDQITVAASSLPTGAATEAKQDLSNVSLSSLDTKTVHVDTGNVIVSSSALPSGASTSALQTVGNASLSSLDAKLNSLGQKASSASVPVVISSDQSPIQVITTTSKGSLIDRSGTVSTTSISAIPANPNRRYLMVQNISAGKIYINFGAAATQSSGSIFLAANGGSFTMEGEFLSTDQVFIISDGSNRAFTAKEA